jgi:hypothetical protein
MHLYHIGKMMCSGALLTLPVRFVLSNMGTVPMKESGTGFVSAYEAKNVGD